MVQKQGFEVRFRSRVYQQGLDVGFRRRVQQQLVCNCPDSGVLPNQLKQSKTETVTFHKQPQGSCSYTLPSTFYPCISRVRARALSSPSPKLLSDVHSHTHTHTHTRQAIKYSSSQGEGMVGIWSETRASSLNVHFIPFQSLRKTIVTDRRADF